MSIADNDNGSIFLQLWYSKETLQNKDQDVFYVTEIIIPSRKTYTLHGHKQSYSHIYTWGDIVLSK